MARAQLGTVVRHLRQLAVPPGEPERADPELLQDFCLRRDQDAFATLVRRHGPMVLGVCRNVLPRAEDAEDAFQATFLVLARKAASVHKAGSLAAWLHGVAYRMALHARRAAARRRSHEEKALARTPDDPARDVAWREIQAILDAEVQRLPEKYRAPFVLCFLEGHSRAEAAALLGVKEGTVWSRLAEARKRLQQRLARRGITLSAVLAAGALAEGAGRAAVPAGLVGTTARAAVAWSAGHTATELVPASAAALANGLLRAALVTKIRTAALALVVGLLALGTGLAAQRASDEPAPVDDDSKPTTAQETPPRRDRFGDPLPPGALQRLGTLRFRERDEIACLAYRPDGKLLATARAGGPIRLWDPTTGKEVRRIEGHEGRLISFGFSPDGTIIASTGGKTVHLWDVATGKEIRRMPCEVTTAIPNGTTWPRVAPLAFTPDGRTLASIAGDRSIRVWDVATGKELHKLVGHESPADCLTFTADGKTLLSASGQRAGEGSFREWDVATGKLLRTLPIPTAEQRKTSWPFTLSPDGRTLVVEGLETLRRREGNATTISTGYHLRLLDLATGRERLKLENLDDPIYSVAFSADGNLIAAIGMGPQVTVWEARTGKRHFQVHGKAGNTMTSGAAITFSPDSKALASVGWGNALQLWDLSGGQELLPTQQAHHSEIRRLAISPDGRTVATGSADQTIGLWDAASGRLRMKLRGHQATIHALAYSPDGRLLASSAHDRTIRLWDAAAGKELHQLTAPDKDNGDGSTTGVTRTIVFTADGKALAAVGTDLKLRLWDAAEGRELAVRSLKLTGVDEKMAGRATAFEHRIGAIAFAPDCRTVALASLRAIHLVDVGTGHELFTLTGHLNAGCLAFSPDGRLLASGGWDKTVRVWELVSGEEVVKVEKLDSVHAVTFAADGRSLAVADGWPGSASLHVLDTATGRELRRFQGHDAYVAALGFSPDGATLVSGQRDSTGLVWDVAALRNRPQAIAPDLDPLWADLAGSGQKAHRAAADLLAAPDQVPAFLAKHLRPVAVKEHEHVARLLADLDGDDFALREAASKELVTLAPHLQPVLRHLLNGTPSVEARRRLEALLALSNPRQRPDAEALRRLRAIGILERIATPEAARVLQALAAGSPAAAETHEAKASRARLAGAGR